MKLKQLIEQIQAVKPGIAASLLTAWVGEAEGYLHTEVLQLSLEDFVPPLLSAAFDARGFLKEDGQLQLAGDWRDSLRTGGKLTLSGMPEAAEVDAGTYRICEIAYDGNSTSVTCEREFTVLTEGEGWLIHVSFDGGDRELLALPPHDKLYFWYLWAMIDFANGEFDQYANTMQKYNADLAEYTRYIARIVRPGNTDAEKRGYYLSAYALAAKHGFSGSEEEWVFAVQSARNQAAAAAAGAASSAEDAQRNQQATESARDRAESAAESAVSASESAAACRDNVNDMKETVEAARGLASTAAVAAESAKQQSMESAAAAQEAKTSAAASAREAEAAKAAIVTAEAEREEAEAKREAAEILREQEKAACIEATEKCRLATEAAMTQFDTVADIQRVTRLGYHDELLPVGDQIAVNRASSVTISKGNSSGITAASVKPMVFIGKVGTAESRQYELVWDGALWKRETGEAAVLEQYGITTVGKPSAGDRLLITVSGIVLTFDILDHDKHEPQASGLTHSLALGAHAVYITSTPQISVPQLLYYAPDGLAAGSYRFTLDHACLGGSTTYDGTYCFTLTQDIPAGGGFRHSNIGAWKSSFSAGDVTGNYIQTYGAQPERAAVETNIPVTVWDGETACLDLGSFTARDKAYHTQDGKHNYTERNACGSNRWRDSALRQWLNSDAAAGSEANGVSNWWTPQSVFDMPPSNAGNAGFLFGMDPEFVSALGYVKTKCAVASCDTADESGIDEVYDRVWLQSAKEVLGDGASAASYAPACKSEGEQLAYWRGASSEERIKYGGGAAQNWWLRTASVNPGYSSLISTTGAASNGVCSLRYAVVPACCIV